MILYPAIKMQYPDNVISWYKMSFILLHIESDVSYSRTKLPYLNIG